MHETQIEVTFRKKNRIKLTMFYLNSKFKTRKHF